jgi:hypothetical protein
MATASQGLSLLMAVANAKADAECPEGGRGRHPDVPVARNARACPVGPPPGRHRLHAEVDGRRGNADGQDPADGRALARRAGQGECGGDDEPDLRVVRRVGQTAHGPVKRRGRHARDGRVHGTVDRAELVQDLRESLPGRPAEPGQFVG